MSVSYSIGVKFAGSGIGSIALQDTIGLHGHGLLQQILCGSSIPSNIPQEYIRSFGLISRILRKLAIYEQKNYLNLLHNILYDYWAANNLKQSPIFLGWGGFCKQSLQKAKSLGAVTVVQWASSHPNFRYRLLKEESERWQVSFSMFRASVDRALAEVELADFVLVPSQFVYDSFIQENFPENKIINIPFGVDLERFRPDKKRGETEPFRILFVGQVGVRKGVPDLLAAWERLKWWPDAELVLVGRVTAESQKVLHRYQDFPGVRWVPHVSEIPQFFNQADVFVFPTIEEGSALVTYEAMASGLPIITTHNAGSLVRHEQEGYLIELHAVDQLVHYLQTLRENPTLRCKLGTAARKRIEDYPWERRGKNLSMRFQELL